MFESILFKFMFINISPSAQNLPTTPQPPTNDDPHPFPEPLDITSQAKIPRKVAPLCSVISTETSPLTSPAILSPDASTSNVFKNN